MKEDLKTLGLMLMETAKANGINHISITCIGESVSVTGYSENKKVVDLYKSQTKNTFSDWSEE